MVGHPVVLGVQDRVEDEVRQPGGRRRLGDPVGHRHLVGVDVGRQVVGGPRAVERRLEAGPRDEVEGDRHAPGGRRVLPPGADPGAHRHPSSEQGGDDGPAGLPRGPDDEDRTRVVVRSCGAGESTTGSGTATVPDPAASCTRATRQTQSTSAAVLPDASLAYPGPRSKNGCAPSAARRSARRASEAASSMTGSSFVPLATTP